MNENEIITAFDNIRVWQRGDSRAPHKPLLVLLALGRLAQGYPAEMNFAEIESSLGQLLKDFGPEGSAKGRNNPFWHLQSDSFWQINGPAALLNRPVRQTASITELRDANVTAGFKPDFSSFLKLHPDIILTLARRLVEAHFPETLQADVLAAVGLDNLSPPGLEETAAEYVATRKARDPAFRAKVLTAYEYRCCVCGHDLRLGSQPIGLEAAHIKWFQAGGPDVETNGLALCSLHHKIFDMGAFTLRPHEYTLIFSQLLMGSEATKALALSHHGKPILPPQSSSFFPQEDYLKWHAREVFKGSPRDI